MREIQLLMCQIIFSLELIFSIGSKYKICLFMALCLIFPVLICLSLLWDHMASNITANFGTISIGYSVAYLCYLPRFLRP